MKKPTILFLCTGNSCRSQMAEGWARYLKSRELVAYSAGIEAHGLNPYALRVMAEVGVDISGQRSQTVSELPVKEFDFVLSVCDHARQHCPRFPAQVQLLCVPFDDPPHLAANLVSEDEILAVYRRVRDEIRNYVAGLPQTLQSPTPCS